MHENHMKSKKNTLFSMIISFRKCKLQISDKDEPNADVTC